MLNNVVGVLAPTGSLNNNSYESIATLNGNGSSTSVSFTSIPSTYKHLQIRGIVREASGVGTGDTFLSFTFNGDTATNYSLHYIIGDGSSATASGGASIAYGYPGIGVQNSATANIYGALIMDVLDYADTNKYKTTRALSGDDRNGSGAISLLSSSWRSTVAVNRIDIISKDGKALSTNTQLALYGIKG